MPWLIAIMVLSFSYGLLGALYLAPADYMQGDGFRILYVHVPCAFLSLFIYVVISVAAILSIVYRLKMATLVIKHSISLGACFTFLALFTGSIWGKPMWGTWWIWDARLTSEFILLLIYLSILVLQSALQGKRQADQIVAIFTLVGCIDLPIIHYSVYWWNTLHQGTTIKLFAPSRIAPEMLYPLLSMLIAFLSYYTLVLFVRLRYELVAKLDNFHWLEKSPC